MEKVIIDLSNIKVIFFDMGNTLIDFHQGPSDSFKDQKGVEAVVRFLLEKYSINIGPEVVYELFIKKWHEAFPQRKLLQKEFAIDDFMVPMLEKINLKLSRQEKIDLMIQFDSEYQKHLVVEEGLGEILAHLKLQFCIGVISNSPSYPEVNINHFKSLKLDTFIDSYTFSYLCKNGKPCEEIFLKAIDSLKTQPSEAMMVGDSLELDLLPARKLGMKTVWLNSKSKSNTTGITPDFEVKSLKSLAAVLLKKSEHL